MHANEDTNEKKVLDADDDLSLAKKKKIHLP